MEVNEKPLDTVSIDTLTVDENLPEVNPSALAAIQADREETTAQIEAETQEEKPRLKKDGTPAKKRGRKPNSEKPAGKPFYNPDKKETGEPLTVDQKAAQQVSSEYAATVISALIENISVKLISVEWQLSETEKLANIKAWQDTFDYYGGVTLTPPQALILSHVGIILTRLPKPETQSKFALGKAWVKSKWQKWKTRNALLDSRPDALRKNNFRKEESGKPEKDAKSKDNSSRPVS